MAAKDLYEKDYYAILGVDKKADAAEIKKKYRSLARELHPDKTKGDKKLEDRFKEVSEAYEILSDDKKRNEYDQAREAFTSGAFRGGGQQFTGDFSDLFGNGGDVFSQLFGGRRGRAKVKTFKPKFLLRCATHSLVKKLISDSQVKAVHHTPSQCEFLLA